MRLSQVSRKFNIGKHTIIDFLESKGFQVEDNPNSKITPEQLSLLAKEFADSALDKEEASSLMIGMKHSENVVIDTSKESKRREEEEEEEIIIKGHHYEAAEPKTTPPAEKEEKPKTPEKVDQIPTEAPKLPGVKVLGKIDLSGTKKKAEVPAEIEEKPAAKAVAPETAEPAAQESEPVEEVRQPVKPIDQHAGVEVIEVKAEQLQGLKVLGKIELPAEKPRKVEKPVASSDDQKDKKKKKRPRKRLQKDEVVGTDSGDKAKTGTGVKRPTLRPKKEEVSDKEIQEQIRATLAKLSGSGKAAGLSRAKYRREKRSAVAEAHEKELIRQQEKSKTLKVNEFISANDLAVLMNCSVNEVIAKCLELGMFVSINQRLDAEAITIIADEFGYDADFATEEEETAFLEEVDNPEDLRDRAPIVTIMGHVDHGKTSLLDFIRKSKVTEGEAGGITQHIGAYDVMTNSGKRIAFLDTPGHEAFTAMRARGAKMTDIAIIVVAADDHVMPQTKEAINHAQVAGVPMVFAINKIDKPNANTERIREELANINILVEDWGGKYQCQELSAKTGVGIEELLEKVLLEAEMLELKANPDRPAAGTVIEAELDRGRGYVATVLVQNGSLRLGDIILAGAHHGRVKAMFDHRGTKLDEAVPSTPVLVLGLDGAPQAGDKFNVMESEREARELAYRRAQLLREQSLRTKKHITLDEIGRRLAIGNFKELNIIVKGDVDGSIEALSDSLLKLSTAEVQVNIIHKAVGPISESDVLLASASDAIIVGFQVRPSTNARKLAEQEEIEIRLYSIIYDAINEIKDAMEGMLAPELKEIITGNAEVREVFKISKVGTVAGCMVVDGSIKRNNQIRLVRDGIVVYTGTVDALKRFKEDMGEVRSGFECGISIRNFNDIKVGDVLESFEQKEVKRTL
jgi:translation initiation factor IF-2